MQLQLYDNAAMLGDFVLHDKKCASLLFVHLVLLFDDSILLVSNDLYIPK